MRRLIALLLILLFLPGLRYAQAPHEEEAEVLAITNVTLIDATGAAAQPDMTVVITGDRISLLGKSAQLKPPKAARIIDGKGKYLMPGLWDMHVHTWNKELFFPLYLANGVTGVRDMFGYIVQINRWRQEIEAGTLVGPRIVAAGPIVDGPKPVWPGSIAVANAEQGREVIDELKERGADFAKVYSLLPRDAYFAIAEEARRQKFPFAGHVPDAVSALEASDAGQKSIEHFTGVLLSCSAAEAELRKARAEALAQPNPIEALRAHRHEHTRRMLETYDEKKAAALFERFAKNGTWQVPTLTVLRVFASINDKSLTEDPRLKYMPEYVKQIWQPKNDFRLKNKTDEDLADEKLIYQKQLEMISAMRRAGVEFLAGTDTPNPYCYPGFSLHDELALLVKAGLTPMEALQTATRNPAKYLGLLDTLGTVEKGKAADLLLLDANPLDDINNTKKIAAVIVRGRLFPRAELDGMLKRIETFVQEQQ